MLPVVRQLIDIDKVFLGITRYGITKENPFSVGEVREIWRQIIDNDRELKKKSSIIEIVTCPARRDLTNVVDAIYELTYRRDSIIVVSGNNRIIEQCVVNGITAHQFRRRTKELRGAEIRQLISQIDFEDLYKSQNLLEALKTKLHPVAFEIMMRDGIFKRSQSYINAV